MSDSQELDPCPFCGARVGAVVTKSELDEDPIPSGWESMTVVCDFTKGGCGATCGMSMKLDRADAAKRWNRRADA